MQIYRNSVKLILTGLLFLSFNSLIACQLQSEQTVAGVESDAEEIRAQTTHSDKQSQPMQNTNNMPDPHNTITAEVLYKNNQCGSEYSAQWVDNPTQYQRIFKSVNKSFLGGANRMPPNVDFDSHSVLYLPMGQRNTGGYMIKLVDPSVRVENDVAKLRIDWHEPVSGMMTIQVLTSPCLFIKMPKAEFSRVIVIDQNNRTRADVKMTK